MYNKYFTMKRSELKEAIKAEIKSVLSEEIKVGDIVTLTTGGDKLEVIDSRQLFGSDMMAYRVKKLDGTKFNANVDFPEIGDETVEYSGDQLKLAEGDLNEVKKGVVVDPDEIMMHINQYQSGNIDGDDLAQAIEEILVAAMNKSVTFSDIREDEDEDDKKAVKGTKSKEAKGLASVATQVEKLKNKLQDNKSEMLKIAKIPRNKRTNAQQDLIDNMADITKELKKLRQVKV